MNSQGAQAGVYIKCRHCGKEFYRPQFEWRYILTRCGIHGRYYFCSWSCLNAYKKALADRQRGRVYAAPTYMSKEISAMLEMIGAEKGEKHSLEDWAEMYGINYYDLWEAKVNARIGILDAVYMLMGKEVI